MPLIGKHAGIITTPVRKIFVGPNKTNTKHKRPLFGERALCLPSVNPRLTLAQFEDRSTGYGLGWHPFSADSFRAILPIHPEPRSRSIFADGPVR